MNETGQFDDQLRDELQVRDAIRQLLSSRGWEILNGWITEEVQKRRDAYELGGIGSMNDTHINGFQRAQLGMLRTIQDMPGMLLANAESAIEQINLATGDEENGEE